MGLKSLPLGAITVSSTGLKTVYTCPAGTRTLVYDVELFVNVAAVTAPQVLITPSGGGPPYGVLINANGAQAVGTLLRFTGKAMMAAGDILQAAAGAFASGAVFYVWASGQEYTT